MPTLKYVLLQVSADSVFACAIVAVAFHYILRALLPQVINPEALPEKL